MMLEMNKVSERVKIHVHFQFQADAQTKYFNDGPGNLTKEEIDSITVSLFFLVDTELKYFGNSCCNGRIYSKGMSK